MDKFRTIIRQGQSLDINRTYVGHILDIPEFVQTLSGPPLETSTDYFVVVFSTGKLSSYMEWLVDV